MTESFCHQRWQTLTNDLILGSFATGYILRGYIPPVANAPAPWQALATGLQEVVP